MRRLLPSPNCGISDWLKYWWSVEITSCDSKVGGILWNVKGSTEEAVAAVADAKAAVVAARDDVVLEDAVADEEASALVASDEGSTEPPAGLDVG